MFSPLKSPISKACLENDIDNFDNLIKNASILDLNQGLAGACSSKSLYFVEKLVKHGAFDFELGLEYACRHGTLECAQFLINHGKIQRFNNALDLAARYGNFDIVRFIVEEKNVTCLLVNVLLTAAQNGHFDIVNFLIKEQQITSHPDIILEFAAQYGHFDTVRFLVEEKGVPARHGIFGLLSKKDESHLNLFQYLLKFPVSFADLNAAFCHSCHKGFEQYARILVYYNVTNFNEGMIYACFGGSLNTFYYTVNCLGANNWNGGLSNAINGIYKSFKSESYKSNYMKNKHEYYEIIRFLIDKGARAADFIKLFQEMDDLDMIHYYIKHATPTKQEYHYLTWKQIRSLFNMEGIIFQTRHTCKIIKRRENRIEFVKRFFEKTYKNPLFDLKNLCNLICSYIEY